MCLAAIFLSKQHPTAAARSVKRSSKERKNLDLEREVRASQEMYVKLTKCALGST